MAEWVANVKDVFMNVMCGKSMDGPKSSTAVSLDGCGEGEGVRCVCVEMVRNVCVVCGYGEVYGV